jgi:hypothetical protein
VNFWINFFWPAVGGLILFGLLMEAAWINLKRIIALIRFLWRWKHER